MTIRSHEATRSVVESAGVVEDETSLGRMDMEHSVQTLQRFSFDFLRSKTGSQ